MTKLKHTGSMKTIADMELQKPMKIKPVKRNKDPDPMITQQFQQPLRTPIIPEVIEQLTPEKAQALVMTTLADKEKIAMHSELSDDRVLNIMAVESMGIRYNIPLLKKIPKIMLPLLVSKDRQGRKEQIDMIKAWASGQREQGFLSRIRQGLF